jgi:hypothetical protein
MSSTPSPYSSCPQLHLCIHQELVSLSDPPSCGIRFFILAKEIWWQVDTHVIIVVGTIRKGVIRFISRVEMVDGLLVVEKIVIIVDKICMMTTRLACNWAIESSYWRMDYDSDVGLLMGYVLYRLPVELEFMDLDTFPHWFGLHPSLLTSW